MRLISDSIKVEFKIVAGERRRAAYTLSFRNKVLVDYSLGHYFFGEEVNLLLAIYDAHKSLNNALNLRQH